MVVTVVRNGITIMVMMISSSTTTINISKDGIAGSNSATGVDLVCLERCENKVHGFSTDPSVSFALCSVSSCRMRRVDGGKNH